MTEQDVMKKEELDDLCEIVTERIVNGFIVNAIMFNEEWDIIRTFHVARVSVQKHKDADNNWAIIAWDRCGRECVMTGYHTFWAHDPDKYRIDYTDILPDARRKIALSDTFFETIDDRRLISLSEKYD
jgi:hypothetical protein